MQKIQNIHAAESDWKVISCLDFPIYSHYFVSFIIKMFFFQILTLGAVRKANLQWIDRFLQYPSVMQGFSPATWSVPKTLCGVEVLMFTLFLLQACAWRATVSYLHAKIFTWKSLPGKISTETSPATQPSLLLLAFSGATSQPVLSLGRQHSFNIYLKCLEILEQPLPWPSYPIFFPKSIGSFLKQSMPCLPLSLGSGPTACHPWCLSYYLFQLVVFSVFKGFVVFHTFN